ncbi:MORN repeat-containing protein [Schleiferia thermophila]|uniref:MORN repeat protein n=1 Tax=Schleiferia thermophila TaxID=884107 RepID=A0A369ABB9_9FLAO|nr:hypothetical protein [Schleiferia thermophila]RCX05596.1 hypothetical protein DES35_101884 [Schleiferia thermophila]
MKQKNSTKLLTLLALLIFLVVNIYQHIHYKNLLQKSELTYDSVVFELKVAKLKMNADEFFYNGEVDNALKIYGEIDSLTGSNLVVEKRAWMEKTQNLARLEAMNSESLVKSYSKALREIDSLKTQLSALKYTSNNTTFLIDSLLQVQNSIRDSLEEYTQNKKSKQYDTLNFVSSTGNLVRYFGEVNNNKANGRGVGIWSTGGYYYGFWKNNFRHGKGVYIWKNGDKYDGDFYDDQREGYGIYYWTSGEKYVGNWKKNMRSGHGTLYGPDGKVKYSGNWSEDKPSE